MSISRISPYEIEGETASFLCSVVAGSNSDKHIEIKWLLIGNTSAPGTNSPCPNKTAIEERRCRDITLFRNFSGYELTCVTVGSYEETSASWIVNVSHPPDEVTLEIEVDLNAVTRHYFVCIASRSNPAVNITWYFIEHDQHSHQEVLRNVKTTKSSLGTYLWETHSKVYVEKAITNVKSVICMISFPGNANATYKELKLTAPDVEETTFLDTRSVSVKPLITETTVSTVLTEDSSYTNIFIVVTAASVLLICVVMLLVLKLYLRQKYGRPSEHGATAPWSQPDESEPNSLEPSSLECLAMAESGFNQCNNDYNFPRENVDFLEVLGCGNFGQVYKAIARGILKEGTTSVVAVKILKKSASSNVVVDFKKEISIHETLTKHSNVVSMLGYCIETDPFYLILEFIPGGNLQHYLRDKKAFWKEAAEEDTFIEPACPIQLLTFASQVANGMEYLSSMGCVHRDLASRNILLGEGLVCKLSDFGMARDVSETDQYEMTSLGVVPVRWFAMECLVDNTYTTMSDVWSFGILLWEIVTLGAHPYRGMSASDIIDSLVEGYRLPQPVYCNRRMFSIMKECWQDVPKRRPSFITLRRTLDLMIADAPMYLNMTRFEPDMYM